MAQGISAGNFAHLKHIFIGNALVFLCGLMHVNQTLHHKMSYKGAQPHITYGMVLVVWHQII